MDVNHLSPYYVGSNPPKKLKLQCKVCYTIPICIDVCGATIIYVHSTTPGMSCACINLRVHKHLVPRGICCEPINNGLYVFCKRGEQNIQCIKLCYRNGNEPTILSGLLVINIWCGDKYHLHKVSLEVVMDKFFTLASPNCRNFVAWFKRLICSRMGTINNIIALKGHYGFKLVYGSRFLGQSKEEKKNVLKMLVDLLGNGINLMNKFQIGGNMENSWIMFDHVKCLCD